LSFCLVEFVGESSCHLSECGDLRLKVADDRGGGDILLCFKDLQGELKSLFVQLCLLSSLPF